MVLHWLFGLLVQSASEKLLARGCFAGCCVIDYLPWRKLQFPPLQETMEIDQGHILQWYIELDLLV